MYLYKVIYKTSLCGFVMEFLFTHNKVSTFKEFPPVQLYNNLIPKCKLPNYIILYLYYVGKYVKTNILVS